MQPTLSVSSNGSLGLKQQLPPRPPAPQIAFSILERIVGVETDNETDTNTDEHVAFSILERIVGVETIVVTLDQGAATAFSILERIVGVETR